MLTFTADVFTVAVFYRGRYFLKPSEYILDRLCGSTTCEMAEQQYGFTPDKGTRNAVFLFEAVGETGCGNVE